MADIEPSKEEEKKRELGSRLREKEGEDWR